MLTYPVPTLLPKTTTTFRVFNEFITLAKCAAIRDKQMEEKVMLAAENRKEDQRLNEIMEKARIDGILAEEEEEQKRQEEIRKGFEVIQQQIREREETQILAQELQERETQEILKAIARQKELDHEAQVQEQVGSRR